MDRARSAEAGAAAATGGEVQQGKHLPHRHLAAYLVKINRGHDRICSTDASKGGHGSVTGREEGRVISVPTCACGFARRFSKRSGETGCFAPWAR